MGDHCSSNPVISNVRMYLSLNGQEIDCTNFSMQPSANGLVGTYLDYTIRMEMETDISMLAFRAVLEHPEKVNCDWIRFDTDITNIVPEHCLVPVLGKTVIDTGLYRPEMNEYLLGEYATEF